MHEIIADTAQRGHAEVPEPGGIAALPLQPVGAERLAALGEGVGIEFNRKKRRTPI